MSASRTHVAVRFVAGCNALAALLASAGVIQPQRALGDAAPTHATLISSPSVPDGARGGFVTPLWRFVATYSGGKIGAATYWSSRSAVNSATVK